MCAENNEAIENENLEQTVGDDAMNPETVAGAEAPADASGTTGKDADPGEALRLEVEGLNKKNQELNNRMLRALADYDNVRKRTEREIWNAKQYGAEDLVKKMLPVIDSFESALKMMSANAVDKKVLDGLEMLFMQFSDILEKEGLKPMKAKGEKFDPNRHEALMKRSDPGVADEVIVTELEKGYFFKEKVLRPAKVEINQH
jgi:molecular chaperone GrpE